MQLIHYNVIHYYERFLYVFEIYNCGIVIYLDLCLLKRLLMITLLNYNYITMNI